MPAALLLALIAGLFDFVPVVGFILSSIFAVIMALTVSPTTALIVVLALYVAYHLVENYVIAPWAYGDRLKLSNVAVILAFAIGAELAGVIGALIALPVAAVYPAIEQIWLRDTLADDTVARAPGDRASQRSWMKLDALSSVRRRGRAAAPARPLHQQHQRDQREEHDAEQLEDADERHHRRLPLDHAEQRGVGAVASRSTASAPAAMNAAAHLREHRLRRRIVRA